MDKQKVYAALKSKGYKFTPQRREIIDTLVNGEGPLSVKELVERMKGDFPELSPDTVYRTLRVLCDLGVVCSIKHQGKKGTRYEMGEEPHHHHLVCISCGKSFCLPFCPMEGKANCMAEQFNFEVIQHTFEILGYCRECRSN